MVDLCKRPAFVVARWSPFNIIYDECSDNTELSSIVALLPTICSVVRCILILLVDAKEVEALSVRGSFQYWNPMTLSHNFDNIFFSRGKVFAEYLSITSPGSIP